MNQTVMVALIGLLAVPLGATITWIFNRRKNVADIYSVLTESSQSAVETMQSAMETLNDELQKAQAKIDQLIEDNLKMHKEIVLLRQQNSMLLQENATLSRKIDDLMKHVSSEQ